MATAIESGYGAFLPQYENELVNREALRGQMVKQASYLTDMDTVFAQLDEKAREFDASLLANKEQWQAELKEKTREATLANELGWYTARNNVTLAQQQMAQSANLAQQQMAQAAEQAANQASQAANLAALFSNLRSGTTSGTASDTSSYNSSAWADVAGVSSSGTVYNEYGNVVSGAGNYNYSSDYNDSYWDSLDWLL